MTLADDLALQAEERLEAGDLAKASELFMQAHEEEAQGRRQSPAGAIGVARIALMIGQLDDARVALDKVLATFPKNAEALTYRGVVEEASGNLDGAVRCYEGAVKLSPKFPVARFNLGRAYGQQKRWKEAIKELQTAARQEPDNLQYVYNLGIAAQGSGNTAQAIEAFSDCIEIDPLHLDSHVTLADILVFAGKDELAIQILKNATGIFPNAGILFEKLAAMALRHGDPAGAGGLIKQQLEVEPDNVHAWLNLGVMAIMVLDLETAEQAAQQAIQLQPGLWRGYFQLGMVYDASNLKDKAKEVLKKAVELAPDEWEPHNNLGTLLMEESKPASWKEAARLIERAVQLGPTREIEVPLYNLALLHWKLGDQQKSKSFAEAAVEQGAPGEKATEEARRFLGNFE